MKNRSRSLIDGVIVNGKIMMQSRERERGEFIILQHHFLSLSPSLSQSH